MTIEQLKKKLNEEDKNFIVGGDEFSIVIYYQNPFADVKTELLRVNWEKTIKNWVVWLNNVKFTQGNVRLLTVPLDFVRNLEDPMAYETETRHEI